MSCLLIVCDLVMYNYFGTVMKNTRYLVPHQGYNLKLPCILTKKGKENIPPETQMAGKQCFLLPG